MAEPSSFRSSVGSLASAASGLGAPQGQRLSSAVVARTEAVARAALGSYSVQILGIDVRMELYGRARPTLFDTTSHPQGPAAAARLVEWIVRQALEEPALAGERAKLYPEGAKGAMDRGAAQQLLMRINLSNRADGSYVFTVRDEQGAPYFERSFSGAQPQPDPAQTALVGQVQQFLTTDTAEAKLIKQALVEAQRSPEATASSVRDLASAVFAGVAPQILSAGLLEGLSRLQRTLPVSPSKQQNTQINAQLRALAEQLGAFVKAHAPLNETARVQVLAATRQIEAIWGWVLEHQKERQVTRPLSAELAAQLDRVREAVPEMEQSPVYGDSFRRLSESPKGALQDLKRRMESLEPPLRLAIANASGRRGTGLQQSALERLKASLPVLNQMVLIAKALGDTASLETLLDLRSGADLALLLQLPSSDPYRPMVSASLPELLVKDLETLIGKLGSSAAGSPLASTFVEGWSQLDSSDPRRNQLEQAVGNKVMEWIRQGQPSELRLFLQAMVPADASNERRQIVQQLLRQSLSSPACAGFVASDATPLEVLREVARGPDSQGIIELLEQSLPQGQTSPMLRSLVLGAMSSAAPNRLADDARRVGNQLQLLSLPEAELKPLLTCAIRDRNYAVMTAALMALDRASSSQGAALQRALQGAMQAQLSSDLTTQSSTFGEWLSFANAALPLDASLGGVVFQERSAQLVNQLAARAVGSSSQRRLAAQQLRERLETLDRPIRLSLANATGSRGVQMQQAALDQLAEGLPSLHQMQLMAAALGDAKLGHQLLDLQSGAALALLSFLPDGDRRFQIARRYLADLQPKDCESLITKLSQTRASDSAAAALIETWGQLGPQDPRKNRITAAVAQKVLGWIRGGESASLLSLLQAFSGAQDSAERLFQAKELLKEALQSATGAAFADADPSAFQALKSIAKEPESAFACNLLKQALLEGYTSPVLRSLVLGALAPQDSDTIRALEAVQIAQRMQFTTLTPNALVGLMTQALRDRNYPVLTAALVVLDRAPPAQSQSLRDALEQAMADQMAQDITTRSSAFGEWLTYTTTRLPRDASIGGTAFGDRSSELVDRLASRCYARWKERHPKSWFQDLCQWTADYAQQKAPAILSKASLASLPPPHAIPAEQMPALMPKLRTLLNVAKEFLSTEKRYLAQQSLLCSMAQIGLEMSKEADKKTCFSHILAAHGREPALAQAFLEGSRDLERAIHQFEQSLKGGSPEDMQQAYQQLVSRLSAFLQDPAFVNQIVSLAGVAPLNAIVEKELEQKVSRGTLGNSTLENYFVPHYGVDKQTFLASVDPSERDAVAGLSLSALAITPVQRLGRVELLLKELQQTISGLNQQTSSPLTAWRASVADLASEVQSPLIRGLRFFANPRAV